LELQTPQSYSEFLSIKITPPPSRPKAARIPCFGRIPQRTGRAQRCDFIQ